MSNNDYRQGADTASFIVGGGVSKAAQAYRGEKSDFQRAAEAQAVGIRGAGAAGAPPQTFFAELNDLLVQLDQVICAADTAASDLRSRLFGPWPIAGEQASGANNLAAPTVCDAALETVRAIIRRAMGLTDTARALEAKL